MQIFNIAALLPAVALAATTSVSSQVNVQGTISASALLSATAPLATATVTAVDSNNRPVAGSIAIVAGGNGPGVCGTNSSGSQVVDAYGSKYTLFCGTQYQSGNPLTAFVSTSWGACLNSCANNASCTSVMWNPSWTLCFLFSYTGQPMTGVSLGVGYNVAIMNTAFAKYPQQMPAPPSSAGSVGTSTVNTLVPASGTISIPGATGSATITSASAVLTAGTVLSIHALWQMK